MFKATEVKPAKPDKPSLTSRFLRIVDLRKWGVSLFLVSVVSVTTFVLAGPAVLADTSLGGSALEAVVATELPVVGFEDKSVFAKLFGLGAVIFWLVLAAANLRRCGVKDFHNDNRIAMPGSDLTLKPLSS